MPELGKILILLGVTLVVIGLLLSFSDKLGWLGRLPGDLRLEKENLRIYFPLGTCLLISAVLSLVLWLLRK